MKTLLSQFCDEFGEVVGPLLGPLRTFSETLAAAASEGVVTSASGAAAPEYVAGFQDVRHRLEQLAEKVEGQQAYVLIFGPLKSGKSTLMNAISASYVSEVTALPAYPCMVFVGHADSQEFVVTRYNGDTQHFAASQSMRMQVNRDHAELADRIRREEAAGREFDPALHLPEAIRRIDVRVPAEELRQSGAVLVDTPGLYSRMKFGYDRMTREFRNTAACAIFVVKTDNLFLEQVFAEFTDLLELFSRVFLVVNLDTTKMDLRPDGTLQPSLERQDPVRIVQAFETLSMSSPIKTAIEEERLRIYPVDLLRAAATRLQSTARGEDGESATQPDEDFRAFLDDLTEYLNSTDYLLAFLGDSLKQATSLAAEGKRLCNHSSVRALVRRRQDLDHERKAEEERLAIHARLDTVDWAPSFEALERELESGVQPRAETLRQDTLRKIDQAIGAWFETDAGLTALIDQDVLPALAAFQSDVALEVEATLKERSRDTSAGALVAESQDGDLAALRVRLGDFASEGLISVLPRAAVQSERVPVDLSEMPIRKTLLDWLLLRTQNKLRKKLLGEGGATKIAERIPRAVKARRFGDAGRAHLEQQLHLALHDWFGQNRTRIANRVVTDYREGLVRALRERLDVLRAGSVDRLAEIERQLVRLTQVAGELDDLEATLDSTAANLTELSGRYAETDPDELVREIVPFAAAEGDSTEGARTRSAIEGPIPAGPYDLHPEEEPQLEDMAAADMSADDLPLGDASRTDDAPSRSGDVTERS